MKTLPLDATPTLSYRAARALLDPATGTLRQIGERPPERVLVERMAEAMAHLVAGGGACTTEDLRRLGFTVAEIDRYRDAAARLARAV